MKKLFLGAALAVSSLTFAQQFGAKAGVNVSSLSKQADLDSKSKVGAYAGIFMNAPLASNFSIQPELLYSLEGNKTTETYPGVKYNYTNNLHMINIPVMFQYNVTPEFYLEAGPQFGFVAGAKGKTKIDGNVVGINVNSDKTVDIKDNFNTFNFSLGAGAGYYFIPNLGVTVRYMAGLTDVVKDNKGDAVHSGVFSAGLAYKF